MKRWISLLVLSLVIGVGLAWMARPLEVQFRWGDGPDQTATLAVSESAALADWTPEEQQAIAGTEAMSKAFVAIAREVSPSVVTIYSERLVTANRPGGNNPFGGMIPDDFFGRFFQMPDRVPQRGMGSGVIISSSGRVLTNNHVVANADRVRVTLSDGRTFDAEVLGRDPKSDVAVVQIDADNLPAVKLGDSDRLEVGEWVLAIGNPFELTQTVTAGIVSAKGRSSVGLADYEDFIQTDAAINPGNSGGALVNLHGEVVGINTAIATRTGGYQGVGFAIPVNMASKIMDSLVRTGKVVRGYLGVTIQDVDMAIADNYGLDHPHGALVNSVTDGSPAAEAGVKAGDLITELNGQPLRNRDELRLRVGEMEPGTSVKLSAVRDGDRRTFDVRLGELPGDDELANLDRGSSGDNGGSTLDKFGFEVQPLDRSMRQQFEIGSDVGGVIVSDVTPGTAASDAGLRPGDVIQEAGREPVESVSDLRKQLGEVEPGRTILLKVYRGEASFFLALRMPR